MKLKCRAIEVMAFSNSVAYLGRTLCMHKQHDTEVSARLAKAWKKFFALKADLCGKHASLRTRLKLFEATVTPTLLYGSGSWTMTVERERLLKTTQRRMLRWMLGSFWKPPAEESSESSDSVNESEEPPDSEGEASDKLLEETWLDWMHRCTHNAEEHL